MSCNDCKLPSCCHIRRYADGDILTVVDQNPEAFVDAYWEINSVRIHTPVVHAH